MVPIIDLVGRLLAESFLLMFLWEFTNAAYSAYISQDPLKKGKSLTDDSKDPNGSLIIGMRSKKGFAKVRPSQDHKQMCRRLMRITGNCIP